MLLSSFSRRVHLRLLLGRIDLDLRLELPIVKLVSAYRLPADALYLSVAKHILAADAI